MKIKHAMMTLALAAGTVLVPSCATMANVNNVSQRQANTVTEVVPGTIISATNCTIRTSGTATGVGAIGGGAIGAALGSLIGSGGGQTVATVGLGLAGAAAGAALTDSLGNTKGQRLIVKVDGKNGRTYEVTQPIYKQYGPLYSGMHGMLSIGNPSTFRPDGY